MIPKTNIRNVFLFVQISCFCVFAGRAYQHLFWDAPYRALLWDEYWMSGIVHALFGMNWEQYSTSLDVDDKIQSFIRLVGWFYLLCASISLFIRRLPKWLGKVLLIGAGSLIFLALLYTKEKFFTIGQFFEYSLQFSSPIFLYLLAYHNLSLDRIGRYMKIAIALTFICHGLYVLNIFPRPGSYSQMVMNVLGTNETTSIYLLNAAGITDLILSVIIFLPFRFAKFALCVIAFWGFMTSIARIWSNWYPEYLLESMHQWVHESILRFPHFLIPIAVILIYQQLENKQV